MFTLKPSESSILDPDTGVIDRRPIFNLGDSRSGTSMSASPPGPGVAAGPVVSEAGPAQTAEVLSEPGPLPGWVHPPAKITAVVIRGSMKNVMTSAHSDFLDSDVLLRWARQKLFDHLYEGNPRSVGPFMQAIGHIELVIFCDSSLGGGLWIDVDPSTEMPVASMLIETGVSPEGTMVVRFLRAQ
jgi:hypothetical protein